MPATKDTYKVISPIKTKTLCLVPRLVLGGLVYWENPNKGRNALSKGQLARRIKQRGPKRPHLCPLF